MDAADMMDRMSFWKLPATLDGFLSAVRTGDPALLPSVLHETAVLVDDGRAYRGDEIRAWIGQYAGMSPATVRPIDHVRQGGMVVLTILTGRGADPPADGPFDWRFQLEAGRIRRVVIEPSWMPELPVSVAGFVRAVNGCDLEALLATFVDDALVNDQLHDYWGKQQLREWASNDIFRDRLTIHVVKSIRHYGQVIVTAHVGGDFDKRGLPNPLVVAFYFSVPGDKIVQLIILRNQSGT
jgi:hypothetical protein